MYAHCVQQQQQQQHPRGAVLVGQPQPPPPHPHPHQPMNSSSAFRPWGPTTTKAFLHTPTMRQCDALLAALRLPGAAGAAESRARGPQHGKAQQQQQHPRGAVLVGQPQPPPPHPHPHQPMNSSSAFRPWGPTTTKAFLHAYNATRRLLAALRLPGAAGAAESRARGPQHGKAQQQQQHPRGAVLVGQPQPPPPHPHPHQPMNSSSAFRPWGPTTTKAFLHAYNATLSSLPYACQEPPELQNPERVVRSTEKRYAERTYQPNPMNSSSAFRPWGPTTTKAFLHAYNATLSSLPYACQEPPELQNPERVVRSTEKRYAERTYQPN
ncbi:cleavage and polyadenylation specificity factor subunit CG7185-like, partial [Drosophila subobscura]|uniref:cleavage and polyadenylation specificity factor subunit CG7185-like n=1 Tax=Drosophila subobscura TaxID=7241 RepID=UPI00155A3563